MTCKLTLHNQFRDRNEVKHFNKAFYTEHEKAAKCSFNCFNDRIIAHFGEEEAQEHDLLYDWDHMTKSYEQLLAINPVHRYEQMMNKTRTEEEQERMMEKLEKQAKRLKRNKFDFY